MDGILRAEYVEYSIWRIFTHLTPLVDGHSGQVPVDLDGGRDGIVEVANGDGIDEGIDLEK